ncbi:MAG TPA: STAS domain-containing protein [Acidimicrobiales bacterium]|nr:STAS domain-containing protein [Acidimicrobiales bacterium]
MDGFGVEAEVVGTQAVVVVTGEIDALTAPALNAKLLELAETGVERVVVDLQGVTFIESVGLGTLVAARKRLGTGDKTVCLVIADHQVNVRRPFEITRLDEVFPIHPTREAAIDACLTEPAA